MDEARQSTAWDHTSLLVATVLNSRQGVKRRHLVRPTKIHPYLRRHRRQAVDGDTAERLLTHALGKPKET